MAPVIQLVIQGVAIMPRIVTIWKHPKTGGLYFDESIPKALQAAAGKGRYRRSLETKSPREAVKRYAEERLVYEVWLRGLTAPALALSARQVSGLTGIWYRRLLDDLGENPDTLETWERVVRYFVPLTAAEQLQIPPPVPRCAPAVVTEDVIDLLAREGLRVDARSQEQLVQSLSAQFKSLADDLWRMARGDYSESTRLRLFAYWEKPKGPAVSITGLLESLVKERERLKAPLAESTVYDFRRYVRQFVEYLGHDDASRVTPTVAREWRTKLAGSGTLSYKSINDGYLAALRSAFRHGVDTGKVESNPISGVRVSAGDRNEPGGEDKEYSEDQALTLLRAARAEVGWKRWAPWLMAYTGCRLGECIALHVTDFVANREVPYVQFGALTTEQGKARPRKSRNAARRVPLHQHLIAEGLLDYVGTLPAGSRLFPDAPPGRAYRESSKASQLLGQWTLQHIQRTEHQRPSHAWRHRLAGRLRAVGVPDETISYLSGRQRGTGTTAQYGGPEGLKLLQKHIRKAALPRP